MKYGYPKIIKNSENICLKILCLSATDVARQVICKRTKMIYRLKASALFFLCLLFFFVRGKANANIKSPKKILVMQMTKLGDMVCTTPMFRSVKGKYPESKVFVIGNNLNKEVLKGNLDVDEYFVYKNNFWALLKKLNKEKIDFACVTHPNFWGLAMLYLAGVKSISGPIIKNGFCPSETKLYKILRKFVVAAPHNMGSYAPREYLRLLEPIGIFSENTKKYLFFSKQAEVVIEKFFAKNNIEPEKDLIAGISPSAGNKIKKWPEKKFAEVADYLYEKYKAKLIIIGDWNDKSEIRHMVDYLNPKTKIFNTLEMFNVDELKALISKMSLFISVDTGPIYIAEAFDVATIDIVGPIDEREQPPIGKMHKIVKLEQRKPELHVMNAGVYNKSEAKRQVELISANMVKEKIDELIAEIKQEK